MTPKAFPAAPYASVTFPDDEFVTVPASLIDALVPPSAVWLYLLLVRLAEGHQAVEVSASQLEQHSGGMGPSSAELAEAIRALKEDGWLATSPGRFQGSYVFHLLRQPSGDENRGQAEVPEGPHLAPPSINTIVARGPAAPAHQTAFQAGQAEAWR